MLLLKIIEIGNGEYYGYKIVQQLQESSDDKIKLAEGVMYPILYRLLDKGYIIDEKRLVGKRKTRVYYKLEPKGKELNIPVDVVPPMLYGRCDGKGVLKLAMDLVHNK